MALTDKQRRGSAAYRHLYRDLRWCGPNGIRRQALLRDLYTCRRCGCLLLGGNPHLECAPEGGH